LFWRVKQRCARCWRMIFRGKHSGKRGE
jgi:hypothetical protein